MRISVRHELRFDLGAPTRALQHLLLTPADTPQQRVERWSIETPGFDTAAAFSDAFGNRAHLISLMRPEGGITVVVGGEVETTDRAGVIGRLPGEPVPAVFRRRRGLAVADAAVLAGLATTGDRIALLHELMARVGPADEPEQVQVQGGQSQAQGDGAPAGADPVAAFIAAARALDIPARHVTGYRLGGPVLHAWAEAWDDGLGWIGFDPLLGLCPTDGHVRLASGLDAATSAPLRTVPAWTEMPAETVTVEGSDG